MAHWQERTGKLLRNSMNYVYKPVDSQFHGGQARMDFLGCFGGGAFVMVEVKESNNQDLFSPFGSGMVTPLQKQALDKVTSSHGIAYLAVGNTNELVNQLCWFPWKDVQLAAGEGRLQMSFHEAEFHLPWKGDKDWSKWRLLPSWRFPDRFEAQQIP